MAVCEHPGTPDKEIRVDISYAKGSDKDLIDAVIHECLHASGWHLSEDYVEQFATDAAEILCRIGFQRDITVPLPRR